MFLSRLHKPGSSFFTELNGGTTPRLDRDRNPRPHQHSSPCVLEQPAGLPLDLVQQEGKRGRGRGRRQPRTIVLAVEMLGKERNNGRKPDSSTLYKYEVEEVSAHMRAPP